MPCPGPEPQAVTPVTPSSLDSLPRHFLDRRHAVHDLHQPAAAERDHPFVDRLAPELQRRRADEDQLAQLLGDLHHFIETHAPLVARVVAALAAGALLRAELLGLVLREAGVDALL